MKKTKKKAIFSILLISVGLFMAFSQNIAAEETLDFNTHLKWKCDIGPTTGSQFAYRTEHNWGERYYAFQAESFNTNGLFDYLNLNVLEIDSVTGKYDLSDQFLNITVGTSDNPFWQLVGGDFLQNNFYNVFPIIPVSNAQDQLTQTVLEWIAANMTSTDNSENTYGGQYGLTQYTVNLESGNNNINLTNGGEYFCNMTYADNGTLLSADMFFDHPYIPGDQFQTFERVPIKEANPVDEVELDVEVNDLLYYKRGFPSKNSWNNFSYIIDSKQYQNADLGNSPEFGLMAKANISTWKPQLDGEWDWLENEQSVFIGAGNDTDVIWNFNDIFHNILYPSGISANDLNRSIYNSYVRHGNEPSESSIGIHQNNVWVKLNWGSNDWKYIEVNGTGILTNLTIVNANTNYQEFSLLKVAYDDFVLPTENLIDDIVWDVQYNDELIYKIDEMEGSGPFYGKYTEFFSDIDYFGDPNGQNSIVSFLNSSFYKWNKKSSGDSYWWNLTEPVESNGNNWTLAGIQNEKTTILEKAFRAYWAVGTDGQFVHDGIAGFLEENLMLDTFDFGNNYFNATSSTNENFYYKMTWFDNDSNEWDREGIINHLSYNISMNGVQNCTYDLVTRQDLPGNNIPDVDFEFIEENGTVIFDGRISVATDTPLEITWDFDDGDGPISGDILEQNTYMENGTYSVTLTIKDSNGDEAQITKNVEVEILINSQGDDGTDDSTDDQSTNGDGDGDGDENDNDNEGDGINSFPTIFLLFAIAIPMIYLGRKIRKK